MTSFEHEAIMFRAKAGCKDCYGRGFILRTIPQGRKQMHTNKTLCHCVTEIKKPEPDKESIVSNEEVVVPKVVRDDTKQYASKAAPSE